MTTELYFLYDTHCPWSYAATRLVNEIQKAYPQIEIHLWHNAYYDGDVSIKPHNISEVTDLSGVQFDKSYLDSLSTNKDSTLAANLMTWAQYKSPHHALPLLNALQEAHFQQGNPLESEADLADIISELKLSPPAKVFKSNKLSKDAEALVHEIFALQEIINTQAIPALLLAIDDDLILLNHNFYLKEPKAIIEAIELELKR